MMTEVADLACGFSVGLLLVVNRSSAVPYPYKAVPYPYKPCRTHTRQSCLAE
jgi:hypothetical protein